MTGEGSAEGDAGEASPGESGEERSRSWLHGRLREAAKGLLGAANRSLHPLWRRRAARAVDRQAPVGRVLFVCHGNICRSPYAEGALRRELSPGLRERVAVESAGFVMPGRPSPPEAAQAAGERSVDLSGHRSRLVTPGSVRAADVVFVMTRGQRSRILDRIPSAAVVLLGDLDPEPQDRRRILDPVARPVEVFRDVYGRIDRCAVALADQIAGATTEGARGRAPDEAGA